MTAVAFVASLFLSVHATLAADPSLGPTIPTSNPPTTENTGPVVSPTPDIPADPNPVETSPNPIASPGSPPGTPGLGPGSAGYPPATQPFNPVPAGVPVNTPTVAPADPPTQTLAPITAPTPISGYTLSIAGRNFATTTPAPAMRSGALVLPLRTVADNLLAEVQVDPANQTVRIIRGEDRAELVIDVKNNRLLVQGAPQGPVPGIQWVDLTPGREMFPQVLIERVFNVFVVLDRQKREIQVNPISEAFTDALKEYDIERSDPNIKQPRLYPIYRPNGAAYDSVINTNNITGTGHITSFRSTSQIGSVIFNKYATYMGSTNGPLWKYALGGIDMVTPHGIEAKGGDYILQTGGLFSNGISRGFIGEKRYGLRTKQGVAVGKLQTTTERVGLQVQRPIFNRRYGLGYFTFDTDDFADKKPFKRPIWTNHRLSGGGGFGGFSDVNDPQFHGRGLITYGYLHDRIVRWGGRIQSNTDLDIGASEGSKNTQALPDGKNKLGGAMIFRNNTTFFNRVSFNTFVQQGSAHWITLDVSNAYSNNFVFSQGAVVRPFNWLNLSVQRTVTRPSSNIGPPNRNKIWSAGVSVSPPQGYLPQVSANTTVQNLNGGSASYFNTVLATQTISPLRTMLTGNWLSSNSGQGPNNSKEFQSVMTLTSVTRLFRNFRVFGTQQWSTPETTNTQVALDTGNLLGRNLKATFGVGRIKSPSQLQKNVMAGFQFFIPYVNQYCAVNFSKYGENYQVIVNLNAAIGRNDYNLGPGAGPISLIVPTGTLEGRFYMDNDLSGTYTPGIDNPMPGLKVIGSSRVLGVTDAEGRYVIKGLGRGFISISTDPISVPATVSYVSPSFQDVFIFPNRSKVVDFRFARFSRVAGAVVLSSPDIDQQYLRDLRITVVGQERDTLTEEDGAFSMGDIIPGKQIIRLDPEYVSPDVQIEVGEIAVDLKPGEKLSNLKFILKPREKQIIERKF